jgi:pimeloyl-ACP methyl ester carboxylesterase
MKPFILSAFCIFTFIESSCINIHKDAKPLKIIDKGVNIAYTDNGKGDTTLLFVHGWCINKTYWTSQVKYFGDKYRVVTVDLPGFGESGKNRKVWNTEAFSRDIDSVISQLNLKNVILIGHSMAGHIVLQAAIDNPQNVIGLVGVDNFKETGGPVPTKKDTADYKQAIDQLKHHFKHTAFDYVNTSLFYKTTADSIKKRVLNDVAKADSVIAVACLELDNFNEAKKLKEVKKKLYLVNSDYTKTDTTGFKINHIPYQVFIIHATGHFPMIEKPKEFNILLRQIISKI